METKAFLEKKKEGWDKERQETELKKLAYEKELELKHKKEIEEEKAKNEEEEGKMNLELMFKLAKMKKKSKLTNRTYSLRS